jgi:phosphatidate cytidylyltransferase
MAPVAIILVWLGSWYFFALLVFSALLMASEWDRLIGGKGHGKNIIALDISIVVALGLFYVGQPFWSMVFTLVGATSSMIFCDNGRRGWSLLGTVYIYLPVFSLLWLRSEPAVGLATVVWLLVLVWATDTGAYVAGRLIGGPKLVPRVSPNKTWAGLFGGVMAAGSVGLVIAIYFGTQSPGYLVFVSTILAVVGQIGDVFESFVKRRFNVKDSGNIIPGHGGVFDRLDSLLFVAMVYAGMLFISPGASIWR